MAKTSVFPETPESKKLASKYGYEPWLVGRFLRYMPEEQVEQFVDKMARPPTRYIRVNTLKTCREDLEQRLRQKGFELRGTVLDDVLAVEKEPMSAGATSEYLLGHYYIQDLSSCLAVEALEVREGQSALDVAAAPGGKTTLIAQKMRNTGSIVALEPVAGRARSMVFNLARMGVMNACVLKTDGERAAEKLGGMDFDRVLLDAPCSCEGVIAKDAARKTSHAPEDVEYCSTRQERLIESAAKMVRPGGILVYSTCSFAPEENEMVVDGFLRKFPEMSVEPSGYGSEGLVRFGGQEFDGSLKNARRLYPHLHDTTGFFIARLRKRWGREEEGGEQEKREKQGG